MHGDAILVTHSVSEDVLLGEGGESKVYALNDRQVLRIYKRGADPDYVERLRRFYATLAEQDLPFRIPVIEDIAIADGVPYAIEQRLHATPLTRYLLASEGAARERALDGFVATAQLIQSIAFAADDFGELLAAEPTRRPSWPDDLRTRARLGLQRGYATIAADVPNLDAVVRAWEAGLDRVGGVREPTLTHGDYFPENVLVDERGRIVAVIDFSPMTVAGDPRLDLLCALIFLELDDGYRPSDSDTVRRSIERRSSASVLELGDVYRTYYSLYFSGVKQSDRSLYDWCVANLRRADLR